MVTHMCGPTLSRTPTRATRTPFHVPFASRLFAAVARTPLLLGHPVNTSRGCGLCVQEALSQPTAAAGRCMVVSHASRLRGFAASRGSFKPNGLTSRLAKVGAPQRTSCAARERVTGTHLSCEERGCWRRSRCARLTGTIGKELEKVCEPSCHRAGRSRARELAHGEI